MYIIIRVLFIRLYSYTYTYDVIVRVHEILFCYGRESECAHSSESHECEI